MRYACKYMRSTMNALKKGESSEVHYCWRNTIRVAYETDIRKYLMVLSLSFRQYISLLSLLLSTLMIYEQNTISMSILKLPYSIVFLEIHNK